MRLATIVSSLNPALGGPVESTVLCERNMKKLGHELSVITLDSPSAPWLKKLTFEPVCLGPAWFSGYTPRLLQYMQQYRREFEAVILHGIWDYPVAIGPALKKLGIPYVVVPHGCLDPYFIDYFPFKHFLKKAPYYKLFVAPSLRDSVAVLFTTDEERRLASQSYMPAAGQRLTMRYGIDLPDFNAATYAGPFRERLNSLKGKRLLLYLGRIHPKKGCDLLLEAYAIARAGRPDSHLLMAGPGDKRWLNKLKRMAEALGIGSHVDWLGPVYGDNKWYLYRTSDAFILPSHMENFGISVVEAMSQGLPVLITDKVNIHNSISANGTGLVDSDDLPGITRLLCEYLDLPDSETKFMGHAARQLVEKEFLARYSAEDLVQIIKDHLHLNRAATGIASGVKSILADS
jgi:glycosyltransferase involved in cell wall biosynthesis